MGFTPLEGLVMATRSGSVDPGLIIWLLQHGGLGLAEVAAGWSSRPGWPGLSGQPTAPATCATSSGPRPRGDPAARLAIEVYLHRLRREIAAMAAAMNGLDALVFTGGIGEHQPAIRAAAAGRPGVPRRRPSTRPQRRPRPRRRHQPPGRSRAAPWSSPPGRTSRSPGRSAPHWRSSRASPLSPPIWAFRPWLADEPGSSVAGISVTWPAPWPEKGADDDYSGDVRTWCSAVPPGHAR